MKAMEGVYFRTEDYASFWLRLFIDVVDTLIVAAVYLMLGAAIMVMLPPTRMTLNLLLVILAVWVFGYFVALKRSSIGTVDYRIGGIRLVSLDGSTPSIPATTFRLMFAPLGPVNWFMDLAWLSGDLHRQSLRDKLAHTYVVKKAAQPLGMGKVIFRQYDICGANFIFQEVEVPGTGSANKAI